MTDNEIIKALECCQQNTQCTNCPMWNSGQNCMNRLYKNALDLINRQKAEIERLTVENKALFEQIRYLDVECERLENLNFDRDVTIGELYIKLEAAKAEAIKEFAERLKADYKNKCMGLSFERCIDNLVKEMVG